METLKSIVNTLIILGVSIAGITFIVLMIKIAIEPEMKSKYLKLTKHLLIATVLISISLTLLELPKYYYGDSIEIVDDKETVNIDGNWYVVTDRGWNLYKYYGQNDTMMSHAYAINVYSVVGVENVDVLRPFSKCQGTFKGFFADISYYRDSDGFIFPYDYSYTSYINAKNSSQNSNRRNK